MTPPDEAAVAAYRLAVHRAIADDHVSDEEVAALARLQATLGLSNTEADEIFGAEVVPLVAPLIRQTSLDRRISIDEAQAVFDRVGRLRVKLELVGEDADAFFRYWDFAKWEAGVLPEERAPFLLDEGETCHFVARAKMAEVGGELVLTDRRAAFFAKNAGWSVAWQHVTKVTHDGATVEITDVSGESTSFESTNAESIAVMSTILMAL